MATEHRFEIIPDEGEATPRRRSKWASCLIGCLMVLGVMLVLMIVVAVWVAKSWRGWAADFGSQAVSHAIDTSDLPPQEKGEVKVQVERVAKSLRDGQISETSQDNPPGGFRIAANAGPGGGSRR